MSDALWRYIPGTKRRYKVTSDGRVIRRYAFSEKQLVGQVRRKTLLTGGEFTMLYVFIRVNEKRTTVSVPRLVYETFVGAVPKGYVVDVANGDVRDCRRENLVLRPHCNFGGHPRRAIEQIAEDGRVLARFSTVQEAARACWCSDDMVRHRLKGITKNPFRNLEFSFRYAPDQTKAEIGAGRRE